MDARPGCPPRQSVECRVMVLEPAPYFKEKPFGELRRVDNRRQPWKEFLKLPEAKAPPADPSKRAMVFDYKAPGAVPVAAPVEVK